MCLPGYTVIERLESTEKTSPPFVCGRAVTLSFISRWNPDLFIFVRSMRRLSTRGSKTWSVRCGRVHSMAYSGMVRSWSAMGNTTRLTVSQCSGAEILPALTGLIEDMSFIIGARPSEAPPETGRRLRSSPHPGRCVTTVGCRGTRNLSLNRTSFMCDSMMKHIVCFEYRHGKVR